ncbi:hypothetical protein [Nonomuraea fuscirosea]|uniref:hypothetical protein n=1 Tax=Nonomuraea fuscirosea TaxID=1291556 RepID=UPI003412BCB2
MISSASRQKATVEGHTDSEGESEPIAKNEQPGGGDNPEGRARDRRVGMPALDSGMTGRGYISYPAPADTVSSVTLEAENLGRVPNLPVS